MFCEETGDWKHMRPGITFPACSSGLQRGSTTRLEMTRSPGLCQRVGRKVFHCSYPLRCRALSLPCISWTVGMLCEFSPRFQTCCIFLPPASLVLRWSYCNTQKRRYRTESDCVSIICIDRWSVLWALWDPSACVLTGMEKVLVYRSLY